MNNNILDRFLRYVAINTQSIPGSHTFPSNPSVLVLAEMLVKELRDMGLSDAHVDDYGYVMATLPANTSKNTSVIGLIAHMDTSPDMSGENISPLIHRNYSGSDILLNESENIVMRVSEFPIMKKYTGQTIITTDGTTLLGADNKAGVAEIMTAVQQLVSNPKIPHGTIKIAFTPDEEIGKGVDHFDTKKFGADFAFTVDGGEVGELQYENFNAAYAKVSIRGRNIHPGEAKGKMINAMLLGMEYNSMLPAKERPEHTTGYEGFYHILHFEGDVDKACMEYIIRDHDHQEFEHRKSKMRHLASLMNDKYGQSSFRVEIKDQYYNMHAKVIPVIEIVDLARKAMLATGVEPIIRPIRGGTDGARLSYMGLPCPNLFTGGHNYHGRFEFIPLESMEKAVLVILKIIELLQHS